MLEGQIALVSGASRGIGKAIAESLGQHGAVVAGTATTDAGAEGIAASFAEVGITGIGLRLNVTEPDSIAQTLGRISDELGGAPDILINNAGITRDNLLMRMKDEEWAQVMETNLTSVYRLSKACLRPMMKARRGRIVNITSVIGATGNAGQSNYAAAKAGMIGFSKALAREVGSRGITVNCVAPGFIETDMTRALPEQQRDSLLSSIPLGRLGTGADVAAAVLFLTSPAADYITGETIHVNGGMHMA
jgi:3-oxoacyl-[acyl-carrier protein] reductase